VEEEQEVVLVGGFGGEWNRVPVDCLSSGDLDEKKPRKPEGLRGKVLVWITYQREPRI